jgi:hypothetical protein
MGGQAGLLELSAGSVLRLDGTDWTVGAVDACFGRVRLESGSGDERWRTFRWLAHHRDCRAVQVVAEDAAGPPRARATLSSEAGAPARSRARRTVGPLGASPGTGARCDSRAMSLMLVAPSAIAVASETSTVPRSKAGEVPFFRRAADSCAVSPAWPAALRSRTAPAWPTSPVPAAVTLRAWSHPLCCMARSAPAGELRACGNRESPRRGRSSLVKPGRDGRSAAVPSHPRDPPLAAHPSGARAPCPPETRTPAHRHKKVIRLLSTPLGLNSGG